MGTNQLNGSLIERLSTPQMYVGAKQNNDSD